MSRNIADIGLGARAELLLEVESRYRRAVAAGVVLDMSRGKPSPEQLDLSNDLLSVVGPSDLRSADGMDCRNYGGLEGLPEARRLFAEVLDVRPDEILVQGNSSLRLMYDSLAQALLVGVPGGSAPWNKAQTVRILCPVPGYDRHFHLCEHLGIEMTPVPLDDGGPEMETVARLAADDPEVRGIFCVPKHSNPTGVTYADEVVEHLATMRTAAPDFRIVWDNAYAVHDLDDGAPRLLNLLERCRQAGNPDRPLIFGSTSKMTFGGGGLSLVAGSPGNVEWWRYWLSRQSIGPDKLNQLRHVRFFGDLAGIERHMQRHAAILRPKFELVEEILERVLRGRGVAEWTTPRGGYFISVDTLPGCATKVVKLAAAAGLKLTEAGAAFPYGADPLDSHLRLAPTFPSLGELESAAGLIADCILLTGIESLATAQQVG